MKRPGLSSDGCGRAVSSSGKLAISKHVWSLAGRVLISLPPHRTATPWRGWVCASCTVTRSYWPARFAGGRAHAARARKGRTKRIILGQCVSAEVEAITWKPRPRFSAETHAALAPHRRDSFGRRDRYG